MILIITVLTFELIVSQQIPNVLLNNGLEIPIVGFGTYKVTAEAVKDAIRAGYRHIDTSLDYDDSELFIGDVVKQLIKEGQGVVKRSDLIIVSKLEARHHQRQLVTHAIKESLKRLQMDYLDMYLVHGPDAELSSTASLTETWQGMEDVLRANLTRAIGVSNFNITQLELIYDNGTAVKPVTNQVFCNPYANQKELLSYMTRHNIVLTAYSPLGGPGVFPDLLNDTKLIEVSKRHNVSAAQVALRYQIQRGVIVIPKANNRKYIRENIDLFNFKLTDQDMKDIEALNKIDHFECQDPC